MDKMIKAKVQLVLHHPFFASIAMRLNYHPDSTIKTACTNGKEILYNLDFLTSLSIQQTEGLLAHEIMHIVLLHHARRGSRNKRKWNTAADYAINPVLLDAGFSLPPGGLIKNKYKNMSAEQIYELLPEDESRDSNDEAVSFGDFEDLPVTTDGNEEIAEIKQAVTQAMVIAQRHGKIPYGIKRMVTETLTSCVSWREQLAKFLTENLITNDYTWTRPNNRYLHSGLYLPGMISNDSSKLGMIAILVDTSGSIQGTLLNQFAAEIQELCEISAEKILVVYVDADVQGTQEFQPEEKLHIEAKGGGGTSFIPGFKYLADNKINPKAVIYLTDGFCTSFPKPPHYPVIWAIFFQSSFNAPFGEVLYVTSKSSF